MTTSAVVRARCDMIWPNLNLDGHRDISYGAYIVLHPVYSSDPSDPNYSWSKATPDGEIRLFITNPNALEQFAQGATYDLVITRVTAEG